MSAASTQEIESEILRRISSPGWVATRGLVSDPADPASSEIECAAIEAVMKGLAKRGLVGLWRLVLFDGGDAILAAARPGFRLDEDLEQRGAWARAERYIDDE